jgi:hypothetical protein
MITGANTNVRYRGILFHVQTEDSGRANPHIISHVYHGGTILGTHKTDYSDHLEDEDLVGVVRGMIEQQHAAMLEKLQSGGFDEVIAQRLGDTAVDAGIEAKGSPESQSKPDTEPEANASPEPEPSVPARRAAPAPPAARRGERTFGEGIGSQKPLDEVILEYLAEKARERTGDRTSTAARKNRPVG